jgi:hypothetical protein
MQINKKLLHTLALLLVIFLLKSLANSATLVEKWYSNGLYKSISQLLRSLFGWVPFSVGDLLYLFVVLFFIYQLGKIIATIYKKQFTWATVKNSLHKLLRASLYTYLFFLLGWGLNYNRLGIGYQLQLNPTDTLTNQGLNQLTNYLLQQVNSTHPKIADSLAQPLTNRQIIQLTKQQYKSITRQLPFLKYTPTALKASSYSTIGNYLAFSGYYNPFTAEAQINTQTPNFLLPFVACHEVAHQLGYAKEDEANFVSYLVSSKSNNANFVYSANLEMFLYAHRYQYILDTAAASKTTKNLHPFVKADIIYMRNFYTKYNNAIEPYVKWLYGKYLQTNNQPKGILTYNESIRLLYAYLRQQKKL